MLFDADLVATLAESVPPVLALALVFVTFLGSVYVVAPATALAVVSADRHRVATWPAIVAGGYGLFVTLKPIFSIARPIVEPPATAVAFPGASSVVYDLAVGPTSSSFPSGHALAATVFWGLVAADARVGPRRLRLFGCASLVVAVALSRVALGVHYVGDVLAGVAVGLAFLTVTLALRDRSSDPVLTAAAVAAVPAAGGLVTGRPADAAVLIAVVLLSAVVFRRR
ncbi:phosphatase PAP2 family protein [Natronobiforma cellulositropha]|uniref:phosphatase PAP2 family protein n=1 Tax=Natronobiforma cellulositropha TaxID=1679076 RepID=UPI0021D5CC4C|nr:phosphatase PAP2 family protein [Natronobiforma cellulositropha]